MVNTRADEGDVAAVDGNRNAGTVHEDAETLASQRDDTTLRADEGMSFEACKGDPVSNKESPTFSGV